MKIKKRFIILAAILLAMTIGSITYVAIDGSTYTERMMFVSNPYAKDSDLEVNVHETFVVTAERAYFDGDGHPCIEFRTTGEKRRKSTEVDVNIKGHGEYKLNIFVDRFGTIFNTDALDFDGYIIVEIVILVGLGLIFITMLLSFLEHLKKAKFSYSMIAYGGAALFCAAIITVLIYGMQWMNTFRGFLQDMLHTGELFALVSAPVMLVICLAMAFSNIWLLRHEGFRPQNMLGIALAFVWFLAIAAVFWCYTDFITFDYDISSYIGSCLSYIVTFMACMLLSTIVCAYLSTRRRPPHDRDYIIILGCGIRKDGTLTPILKGRTDAAIGFEKEQFAANGRHAKFVPSGGQGADEVISESEAMKRYLIQQGYPEDQIIMEDKSVNTDQNIKFSTEKIREDAGSLENIKAGIATTNYHIFRGYVLAKKHKLDAMGISAKTKWYFFPNAFLREFAGLIVDRKWKIAITIVLILIGYTIGAQMLSMR